ncbi:hypothetical protein [Aliiglaciecola litoralis]|uniref:Uncharacterized protein n=1 Tax=Aliiglaciecola litoralis TaxID=582857 RepID=A0ABN1LHY0_9ALTE
MSKFFKLGFSWQDAKRISIFYTTDAAISASVFSLGLICRDLCDESKNDKALHFTRLVNNASDYLNKCHSCQFKCQPEKVNCNRLEQAIPRYKKIGDSKVYEIESFDLVNRTITVSTIKKPTKRNPIHSKLKSTIIENYSDSWHIHGKPSLIPSDKTPKLGSLYSDLTQGLAVNTNLAHSYSQLSLVSSNNQLVHRLNEVVVSINGCEEILGELLTLANDRVSRINSITALNQQGIEFISSSKSVIYTCLYSAMKTIEKNRLRDSEKFIFLDPLESDNKIEELLAYISSNIDWLTLNDSNTQTVASALGLSDAEVILLDEN